MEDKNLEILKDEELVELAQGGSARALELLLRRYKGLAKNKARTYFIAGGDRDDVIQEGLIGVFEAVRDFKAEGGASFSTFAELCVNRQIISAVKSSNRKKHQILNDSVSLSREIDSEQEEGITGEFVLRADEDSEPEKSLLIHEVAEYLRQDGIELFSKFENQVWLGMRSGKTYREIAEDLGKSPKAVDNAIQRIRRKIYEFLEY